MLQTGIKAFVYVVVLLSLTPGLTWLDTAALGTDDGNPAVHTEFWNSLLVTGRFEIFNRQV